NLSFLKHAGARSPWCRTELIDRGGLVTGPIEHFEPMLELIGFAYQAAQDETLWPGLACRIASVFDAAGAALFAIGAGGGRVLTKTPDIDDDRLREYRAQYPGLAAGNGRAIEPALPYGAEANEPLYGIGGIQGWSGDSQTGQVGSYRSI